MQICEHRFLELQRERERERGNELRELRKSREVRLSEDKNASVEKAGQFA